MIPIFTRAYKKKVNKKVELTVTANHIAFFLTDCLFTEAVNSLARCVRIETLRLVISTLFPSAFRRL